MRGRKKVKDADSTSLSEATRGRTQEEAGVVGEVTVPGQERPPAPADMGHEERVVWEQTVASMPAGWFGGETFPLLRLFCFHTCLANKMISRVSYDSDEEI